MIHVGAWSLAFSCPRARSLQLMIHLAQLLARLLVAGLALRRQFLLRVQLPGATARQKSIIARPTSEMAQFAQLDDLGKEGEGPDRAWQTFSGASTIQLGRSRNVWGRCCESWVAGLTVRAYSMSDAIGVLECKYCSSSSAQVKSAASTSTRSTRAARNNDSRANLRAASFSQSGVPITFRFRMNTSMLSSTSECCIMLWTGKPVWPKFSVSSSPWGLFFFEEVTRAALNRWIYRTFLDHPAENRFSEAEFVAELLVFSHLNSVALGLRSRWHQFQRRDGPEGMT
jgi:hypothetical protein